MGVKVREHRGAWWLFIDHQGRRKAKRVGPGRTGKKTAEAAAERLRGKLAAGDGLGLDVLDEKKVPTFAEYAHQWLDSVAAVRCQESTVEQYRMRLRVRLLPAFGTLPLTSISRDRIRAFVAAEHRTGHRGRPGAPVTPSTLMGSVMLLAQILGAALDDGIIPNNPATKWGRAVNQRQTEAEEVEVFTPAEIERLLAATERLYPILHPFVFTLARTGMRIGEAAALEWQDVDLERRIILVRRTVSGRRQRRSVPKSGKARRVDMSRQLCQTLTNWRTLQAAEAAVAGQDAPASVFQALRGAPINAGVFRRIAWPRILQAADVRHRKPHCLRHSFASLLLSAGEPLPYIQKALGHHSPAFTLAVYGHLIPQGDRRAVDVLDGALHASQRNPDATLSETR